MKSYSPSVRRGRGFSFRIKSGGIKTWVPSLWISMSLICTYAARAAGAERPPLRPRRQPRRAPSGKPATRRRRGPRTAPRGSGRRCRRAAAGLSGRAGARASAGRPARRNDGEAAGEPVVARRTTLAQRVQRDIGSVGRALPGLVRVRAPRSLDLGGFPGSAREQAGCDGHGADGTGTGSALHAAGAVDIATPRD